LGLYRTIQQRFLIWDQPGQSAYFESKGRIRHHLAAIPTYIIMLACPTPLGAPALLPEG